MKNKYRVGFFPIFWRFILVFVFILVAAYFAFAGIFVKYDTSGVIFLEWKAEQIITFIIIVVLGISVFILSLFSYYYVFENNCFLLVKFGKTYQYDYKNIIFVDFEKAKKQDTITLYTKNAKMQYLLHDKNHKLIEELEKRCNNLLSVDEFRRLHPEEKYK